MKSLTTRDLHFVVTRVPRDVLEMCKKRGLIIGGGFIRETISGGEVKDIDLFGKTVKSLEKAAKKLNKKRKGRMFATNNAITLLTGNRKPVQFIKRWLFDDMEGCMDSFDFTVCQAAIKYTKDIGKWESVISDDFYSDLAAKRLVYTFPDRQEDAGGSMLRAVKFLRRGYNIQIDSLAGVMGRVAAQLKPHIAGDEQEIATVLKGLLVEVDPLKVVDGIDVEENEHVLE